MSKTNNIFKDYSKTILNEYTSSFYFQILWNVMSSRPFSANTPQDSASALQDNASLLQDSANALQNSANALQNSASTLQDSASALQDSASARQNIEMMVSAI